MADWSHIEFGRRLRLRRPQELLPILADIITIWDFFACLLCAEVTLHLVNCGAWRRESGFLLCPWTSQDWLWQSSAIALALRDPDLTSRQRVVCTTQLIWGAQKRSFLAFAALYAITVLFRNEKYTYCLWVPCWGAAFAVFVAISRWMVGTYLKVLHYKGGLREAVALIGASGPRNRLAASISSGADVVEEFNVHPPDLVCEDAIESLLELGRGGALDSVVVAAENEEPGDVAMLVERLKVLPVEVVVSAGRDSLQPLTPDMRILGGMPVAVVADCPIKQRDLLVKTMIDKVVALVILLFLAPLILAIALAVGTTSQGKIIFEQRRQGWCGRSFTILKFRTMREPPCGSVWQGQTERNDVRCTRVGRFLRRTSLDELPQLWNVLRGDMSLVGPRPHADHLHGIDTASREIITQYAQRNRVKPGMTGWAQIHGARGATEDIEQLAQRIAYDLYYIEHWSLWLDFQILARTVFCFFGENAY